MLVWLFWVLLLWPSPAMAAEPCPNNAPLAFEGAEGFGRCAQGGRGGRTIDVTNLNSAGPGSLRQCAEVESGPRTCRFTVSGTIVLVPPAGPSSDIVIKNDFVTIDGSTAPGGGIALKDGGITVMGSHVILRHLRVRPGLKSFIERGSNANGIGVMSDGDRRSTDVIIDHCSVSWTSDDSVYVVFGADRITYQWNLISDSVGPNDPRGKHFLMGYGARSVSFHHNLGAHGFTRWPEVSGGNLGAEFGPEAAGRLDFVNNVNYNGSGSDTLVDPHHGWVFANFIGNYWQAGKDAGVQYASVKLYGNLPWSVGSSVHVFNNYGVYGCGSGILCTGVATPDKKIVEHDGSTIAEPDARFPFPQVTTTDPVTARLQVLAGTGAFPRDSYDTRIVEEVRTGTGHRMTTPQTQIGPWPVLTGGVTPPVDTDGDGVLDSVDACPTVVGPASNNGCPIVIPPPPPIDTDGDGVPDLTDACPTVVGPASNQGCPVIVPPLPPSPSKFGVTEKTERRVIISGTTADCPGGITNTSTQTKDAAGKMVTKTVTVTCKP